MKYIGAFINISVGVNLSNILGVDTISRFKIYIMLFFIGLLVSELQKLLLL